jgi:RNA recognition motif-containing protein
MGGGGGGGSYGGGGGGGRRGGVRPNDIAGGPSVLKLRGLPFRISDREIEDFFRGYNVRNVSITMDMDGRPSGEAMAQFSSPEDAAKALSEKNRGHIGSRYVELFATH